MKRILAALACAMSLTGTAMGQNGPNFGSRTSGLGNAGGFATGSGFSNGSAGSSNFGWSTGAAFGSAGGFSNGSNAAYNFGGPAVPAFITGSSYWGSNNVGTSSLANPATPGLGLGPAGPGVGGLDAMMPGGLGWGGTGLYNGGFPLGAELPLLAQGAAGIGPGVPGLDYGIPMTGYGLAPPALSNATNVAPNVASRRTENFTNNATLDRRNRYLAGAPIATANALRIQDRIARIAPRANFQNVKVLMSGRTVVLRGSVESQADEQLVQRLTSLEPGVDGVISQLDYPGKPLTTSASAR